MSTEKFGMTSPKKRTSAECQIRRNGNESTFRRYIGVNLDVAPRLLNETVDLR